MSSEAASAPGDPARAAPPAAGKLRLFAQLLAPHRGWITVIFVAMLIETAMTIAAPWPLKIVIDNVVGSHKPPDWIHWFRFVSLGHDKLELAAAAAAAMLVI